MTIGGRIKAAREQRGWKQARLAEICGWGVSRLGNYETNQRDPGIEELSLLAAKLEKSIDWLLTGQDPVDGVLEVLLHVERFQKERGWVVTPEEKVELVSAVYRSLHDEAMDLNKPVADVITFTEVRKIVRALAGKGR